MLSPDFNQFRFAQNLILIIFKKNPLKFDGVLANIIEQILTCTNNQHITNDSVSETAFLLLEKLSFDMQTHLGGSNGLNNILVKYAGDKNFLLSLSLLSLLVPGICSGIAAVDLVVSLEKIAYPENESLNSIEEIVHWNFSQAIPLRLTEDLEFALCSLFYAFDMQENLISDKEIEIYYQKAFFLKNLDQNESSGYKLLKAEFIEKLKRYPYLLRFAQANVYIDLIAFNKKVASYFENQQIVNDFTRDVTETLSKLITQQSALNSEYQINKNAYEQALEIEKKRFFQLKGLFSGTGILPRSNFLRFLKDTLNYPMPYGMIISSYRHVVNLLKDKQFCFQDPNGKQAVANFNNKKELNKLFDSIYKALFSNNTCRDNITISIQAYYLNVPPFELSQQLLDTSNYFLPEDKAHLDEIHILKGLFIHSLRHDLLRILQNYNHLNQKYPQALAAAFEKAGKDPVRKLINGSTTLVYFQTVLSYLFPLDESFIPNAFEKIQIYLSEAMEYTKENWIQTKQQRIFNDCINQFSESNPIEYWNYLSRWEGYIGLLKSMNFRLSAEPWLTYNTSEMPPIRANLPLPKYSKGLFFQLPKNIDPEPEKNKTPVIKFNL